MITIEIDGHVYAVCQHACYDADGTDLHTFCGALVDVTDTPDTETVDCGIESNHVSTYNERTA